MSEPKHFNSGNVFGRIVEEPKKETSRGGEEYISFKVNVSGQRSGTVTAYCRIWTADRTVPFLSAWRKNPEAPFYLKGFYGQYQDEKNNFLSNFTIFQFEQRDKVDPRAVFILRGVINNAMPANDGGQRLLFTVQREGQQEEQFELWTVGERLLDQVEAGQFCEVKGYVRQETIEDEFGGSSGSIRAFVHELRRLS